MNKRNILLAMVTTFLFLSITASSWGATQLYVVRASDNSLWKQTCTGLSCSAWAVISGLFASQPTLIWDEYISRYVLTGVATNGSIWRSTFDVNGNHNNDWVNVPGLTASPVAAAGGDTFESHVWYSTSGATTTILTTCTNYSGGSVAFTAPANGIAYVDADVILYLSHTVGTDDFGYLYIGTTATDCSSSYFSQFQVPGTYPTDTGRIPVHVGESFAVTANTSYTYYLNGNMSTGQNVSDYFWYSRMKVVFYPY